MADGPRQVDAVRLPVGFGGPDGIARLQTILKPVLGPGNVYVRNMTTYNFVTRDPTDQLFYPTGHPRAKEPRYDWTDMGGGISYGYLRDDPQPAEPTLPVPTGPPMTVSEGAANAR